MLPNQLTVTLIVMFLGLVTLTALAISGVLIYKGNSDLGTIVVISGYGTTSLGGLIGLLGGTAVRNGTHHSTKQGEVKNAHND